ncbi:uncharacterized protein [Amphiura filiformis]|uniref:uncharacterized protein isoform X2 n=1 Tax=Amphiura filiformis TaxID=82378 RepID=UPI003B212765
MGHAVISVVFMIGILTTLNLSICFGQIPPTTNAVNTEASAIPNECSDGYIKCPETRQCIPPGWVCDEYDDCGDNWDELNCSASVASECSDGYIECPETSKCIPPGWVCDQYDDCGDNWDELNCSTSIAYDNVTVPLCTRKHLCKSTGCSEDHQNALKLCHCDTACIFFDDCCIDYKDECSDQQSGKFQNMLDSRDLVIADRQCVTLNGNSYDSYWMVSKCNKDLGVVSKRCQEPVCNDTLSIVPVIDSFGITYRNVYCAVCHNVLTSELTAWEGTLDCEESSLDQNEIDGNFLCSACSLTLNPPATFLSSATAARKCEPQMLSGCVNVSDDALKGGCETYTAMINVNGEIYRNPHCFLCSINNDVKFDNESDVNCGGTSIPMYNVPLYGDSGGDTNYYSSVVLGAPAAEMPILNDPVYASDYEQFDNPIPPPQPVGVPLSIVLDFGSSRRDSSVKILRNTEIIKETIITCPEGEVYVEHRDGSWDCIPLTCAEGFKLQDGKCLPKVSNIPCGTNVLNSTVILTITLHTQLCKDSLYRNVSEKLLPHLVHTDLLENAIIADVSITCNKTLPNSIDISYTISGAADLFEMVQDQFKIETFNSLQSFLRIPSKISTIEITKSCLKSGFEYTCDTEWISENDHTISLQNGSYALFLNTSAEWITADGVVFRVRYQTHNVTNKFNKKFDVKICHMESYLNCPYVRMNLSSFENWNTSDGMIKYIPNGIILKPSEYFITSSDEALVCNFLNQSVVLNVTYTVSFFEYSNAQTVVSIIGSVLSLIAVILTFLTYAVFASLRNRASRLIMNLIIALFLGQFLLLFGGNKTENENACMIIAVLAHYTWLAAFAWMNALAFDLDRTFGNPDNLQKMSEGKKSMFLYMIYAWGSPFLIVIPCLALHFCQCTLVKFNYGSASACWISDGTANLLTFGVPAAIFLLFNAILFGHTVAGIRSAKRATARIRQDTSKLKRTTNELLIYIKIASLMGFTWIFGYVAAFTGVEALWYIYIILNSLQGVFIFISFMCNRRVGLLWSKKLKLSGLITAPKSSTSGATGGHRASSAPGTQMTGYYSSRQSVQQDGSDQPLKKEIHV